MSTDDKQFDKHEIPEIVQKARQIIARDDHENTTLKSRILRPGLTEEYQLAKGVVEFYEQATRMLAAEQDRLLLASEDEIRKEILADGRDPDEYLKAMDTVMKVTTENAILKHDLQKALATHSADLSARGEGWIAVSDRLPESGNICGGEVDLSRATEPTVDWAGGRGKPSGDGGKS